MTTAQASATGRTVLAGSGAAGGRSAFGRRVSVLTAVVGTELRLRVRDPAVPVLLAAVLAVCALLVPSPGAGYAVLTLDGRKPIFSADTALVAAGIVLGLLLLPTFALALDAGHARDRRGQIDRLNRSSPVDGAALASGRMLAGLAFALLASLLALVVVSSTVMARYDGVPSARAAAVFLLTVAPVAMCGALLAAGLDRFLPERNGVRTALAFAAWSAGIALWAAAGRDVFGLGYLAAATAGDGHVPALSVGVIASQGIPSVAWTFAPLEPAFIAGRLGFALLATAAAAGLGSLLRFQSVASPSSVPHLPSVRVEEERATPRPTLAIVAAQTGSLAGTSLIIAGRWMRRSRLAWMGMAGALIAALVPGTAPGVALAVALTVPMAVVSRTSAREVHVASALEATTAAFLRPSAALMHGWVLGVLTLAPALPAVARMGGVQAATACAGVLGSALWLTWTHRCAARPLLGISTLAALWYLNVFDAPPGPLDLLGLWHPSPSALVAATSFTAAMAWLLWRSDRRTAGARRMPA